MIECELVVNTGLYVQGSSDYQTEIPQAIANPAFVCHVVEQLPAARSKIHPRDSARSAFTMSDV